MATPHIWLIISLEAFAVVALICALLLFYIRKLRRLIDRQQQTLRQAMEQADPESAPETTHGAESAPPASALAYLQRELEATESYYQAEHSTIPLDEFNPAEAVPMARAAVIRHKLLSLQLASVDTPWSTETWAQWLEELAPLLGDDHSRLAELEEALQTRDQRIANLETFKQLFFDLEQQWENAQSQANLYHQQLSDMTRELDNTAQFDKTLQQYHDVYNEVSAQFVQGRTEAEMPEQQVVTLSRADPRTAEELAKLRTVAADQHRIIGKLQKRLREAESAEQKELVIKELEGQLQQHLRYIKESETCVELLEKELSAARQKVSQLEHTQGTDTEETEAMRAALQQFTEESKELLGWINKLESENEELKAALTRSTNADAKPRTEANPALQTELDKLKQEYTSLEEKYLDLKLKSRRQPSPQG